MKKIVFAVAILLLASPAWALDIWCVNDTNLVTVKYDGARGDPCTRAFALDIRLDGDGTISDVQCLSASFGFQIYPGSIDIDSLGNVDDWGSCKCGGSYPGTLDDVNAMTIEAGSLYEEGVDEDPCDAGDLVSFIVSGTGLVNVTLSENTIRGGVVDEDAGEVTPSITDCNVNLPYPTCLSSDAPEFADWEAWGSPDCWCYPRQCRGDIDGLRIMMKWVQAADLAKFREAFLKSDVDLAAVVDGICADLDHARIMMKRVQANDLAEFRKYFLKSDVDVPVCDQAPVINGPWNFWTSP
jgi:hypothetical protein